MPCLICGSAETVRSHILPRALMHDIRAGEKHAVAGWRNRDGLVFTQSGFWDGEILCAAHEGALHDADTYAVEFCRTFDEVAQPTPQGNGFMLPNPRPEILPRFAMSVVWRYCVSHFGLAQGAKLGPWEHTLRSLIFDGRTTVTAPDLMVIRQLAQIDGRTIPFATQPHSARHNGITYWQFQVAGLLFRLKLDRRPDGMPAMLLAAGSDPLVVCDMGPQDVRHVKGYQRVFERMAAGRKPQNRRSV